MVPLLGIFFLLAVALYGVIISRFMNATFSQLNPQLGNPFPFMALFTGVLMGLPFFLIGFPLLLVLRALARGPGGRRFVGLDFAFLGFSSFPATTA